MNKEKSATQRRIRVVTLDKDANKVETVAVKAATIQKQSAPVKTQANIPFNCC